MATLEQQSPTDSIPLVELVPAIQTRAVKPIDKVETPIIACNDSFPTNRIRRPSTPGKVVKPSGVCPSGSVTLGRKGRNEKKQGSRIRSASAGRDHKSEMCSRYWAYLFENLERSISEIYEGCEKEENIRQCKEVVLILENYTRDFTKLIEWLHLKWSYEKTPPPMRPTALAWEIRKPSLCLLPHTRAYEKLLGLRESGSRTEDDAQNSSKREPTLEPIGLIETSKVKLTPVTNTTKSPILKSSAFELLTDSTSHSNTNTSDPLVLTATNVCVSDVSNTTVNFCVPLPLNSQLETMTSGQSGVVDIGLQTDLEEDPDIFYFAGGRTVAFQTDYCDEYGPLCPISFKSMPTILVLSTTDSEMDFVDVKSSVADSLKPNNNSCEFDVTKTKTDQTDTENGNAVPSLTVLTDPTTNSHPTLFDVSNNNLAKSSIPSQLSPRVINDPQSIPINMRPTTPIETKSSATQLSAGVLITDETPVEKNPSNKSTSGDASNAKVLQNEKESILPNVVKAPKISPSTPTTPLPTRSTFAEKAKNGMLRQNQNQAKSVSSYLNKVGVAGSNTVKPGSISVSGVSKAKGVTIAATSTSVENSRAATVGVRGRPTAATTSTMGSKSIQSGNNLQGQVKGKVVPGPTPNYRSNIASRCRTAVNTGQLPQPEQSQQTKCAKDRTNKSTPLSSTSSASPSKASVPNDQNVTITDKVVSSPTGTEIDTSSTRDIGEPDKDTDASSSINRARVAKTGLSGQSTPVRDRRTSLDKKGHGHRDFANSAGSIPISLDIDSKQQAAVLPSNPINSKLGITRSKSMINPLLATRKGQLQNEKSRKNVSGAKGLITPAGSFKRLHSNSYISLPDETSYRRRSHTVDEDGWETVKTRSSRSKWSSSNSSLGSSNVNQSRNSLDKGVPSATTVNNSPSVSLGNTVSSNSTNTESHVESKSPNKNKKSTEIKSNAKTNKEKGDSNVKKDSNRNHNQTQEQTQTVTNIDGNGDKEIIEDESVDYEEIKKKEEDLDNAMREEELLVEELWQVEKDFERIENDSTTEDGTITDSEHAPSPEVPDVEMDDQFFFVSIDDQDSTKMEDLPPREPGRILSLREKLMSPAKKCDGAETLKRYEAKLAKAERNREKLLQSKFNRYVELSDRFEALNETTKKLVAERAELIVKAEKRRKRAEEKRQQFLKSIRRKAHDEDSKAKEIAFINLLEAQNKRHDYFASAQEAEDRLQTIQEERRLKLEERSGKASLVIKRQSHIRKDWQHKLRDLQEKRRKVDERITREKEERAKERSEMAQEKARDREERISALNAAKQAEKEELQKKIKQKQEDTARRHEENMEQIRQKAIELGTPRIQEENAAPTSLRICTLCKVIIQSEIHEMQHIRGRSHLDAVKKLDKLSAEDNSCGLKFGLKFIADVQTDKIDSKFQPDKNRNKGVKKHTKKLMQKLMDNGLEFEKSERENRTDKQIGDPNLKSKTRKNLLELDRLIALFSNNKGSFNTATTMDRLMADVRKAAVQNSYIKDAIIGINGIGIALKILQCNALDLPVKTKVTAVEMIHGFIVGSLDNGLYILRGTGICTIMNLCAERWITLIPDDNRWLCGSPLGANESLPTDHFIQSIVALLLNVLEYVPDPFNGILKKGTYLTQDEILSIRNRTYDIIGYLVASGVVDRISVYCGGVRGPVDNQLAVASLLQVFIDFLVVLVYALQFCWGENAAGCIMQKKEADGTQLLAALEASELAGAVSMSYSLLLHQGAPSRPRTAEANSDKIVPPPPGEKTVEVVKSTLCLINAMARLDLLALQNVLASEAVSLQFRHIASQLLWQVVPNRHPTIMRRLLTELIISIGNFAVGNTHNQATIQSGQTPTVLQLLCTLPQEYFTDSKFKHNFLPTLLAATQNCSENKEILLQHDISPEILDNYLNSDDGKKNVIIRRMNCVTSQPQNIVLNKGTGKKGKASKRTVTVKPLEESNLK